MMMATKNNHYEDENKYDEQDEEHHERADGKGSGDGITEDDLRPVLQVEGVQEDPDRRQLPQNRDLGIKAP